ncbi:universal stress protein [Tomitella biformata]|uniref:universal stress protein n=1 Tax=Tomitella biformata TaxID=630403 RepID=UPI000465A1F9|nr:universal stress protein [Tomitella biformata]
MTEQPETIRENVVLPDALWVGVDGSPDSDRAVEWAARTAAERAWPLQLATAVSVPSMFYMEPSPAVFIEGELARVADQQLRRAETIARRVGGPELEIGYMQQIAGAAELLLDASADARTVVLGTRGHGEVTGMLVGSVARAVVGHAQCPAVVIPRPEADSPKPEEMSGLPVVVGVDGSAASEAAVEMAFGEASARGVPLVAISVWSDATVHPALGSTPEGPQWSRVQVMEEQVLSERLAGYREIYIDVPVRTLVERENPVRMLAEQSRRAQLVVVGTRGRGGFRGLLLGSTSHAMLQHTRCPLMVVRPDAVLP